jgi:hypothetical protein
VWLCRGGPDELVREEDEPGTDGPGAEEPRGLRVAVLPEEAMARAEHDGKVLHRPGAAGRILVVGSDEREGA